MIFRKDQTVESQLEVVILPQPDDFTCGPTCLDALYRYYDDELPLEQVVADVPQLEGGGTLAVNMACHALRRGYGADIFTYNLQLFDPTWFLPGVDLADKLIRQKEAKLNAKLRLASDAYLEFLELGGQLCYEDLTPSLIRKFLNHQTPILTGLSATYLYRNAREFGIDDELDDIRGEPAGHFVVLCGYHRGKREVLVADPLLSNPVAGTNKYWVSIDRLIAAILLGMVTYDANLLIIRPRQAKERNGNAHRRQ